MEYIVNTDARKIDFLNNGFSYCGHNVLEMKKFLYKKVIQLIVTVDYTEEDIGLYTRIIDMNTGNSYPLNKYYIDEVKDKVLQNFYKEMNRLVNLRLIKPASNKSKKRRYSNDKIKK